MIIQTIDEGRLIGKMYHNAMGYNYKVFYDKKVVAIGYVHLVDKNLCLERLKADMRNVDITKMKKL